MIIGVTGTLGAGKGTVVEYLVSHKNFVHYSVRHFLNEELLVRGLASNRDTMTDLANELRAKHGSGYIIEQLYARAAACKEDGVIESVRSIGEAEFLKKHTALLWGVDADQKARYERIVKRASETDKISFEKFVADEAREFTNADFTKQNISGVMQMADHIFHNDGTREELFAQVEQALTKAEDTI